MIRKNRGFTLLEALIGFLILSVGMLGVASLQALSLKAGKTSVYSSVALLRVEQLFENMRANPTELVPALGVSAYLAAGVPADCEGAICSTAAMAANDVFLLEQSLAHGLPDALSTTVAVTIVPEPAPSRMVTVSVTVNWTERSKADPSGTVAKNYFTAATMCSVTQNTAC